MAYTMAGAYHASKYQKLYKAAKKAATSKQPTIPAGFDQVYKDLMAYNGTFNLLLNIRSAIMRYGKLSDKQWMAAQKCLAPQAVQDPSLILVDICNIPITVTPTSARYIAKKHNWPVNPCTLTATQIISQDSRTVTLRVKMDWSSNVSSCRCCGKTLTDWKSQATGVGPYCVKRTSIPYVRNQADVARFQKEMEDLCAKMGEVEVVIKKYHIKEGRRNLDAAVQASSPTKIEVNVPTNLVFPLSYCDWKEKERVLLMKEHLSPTSLEHAKAVSIHNSVTDKSVNFISHISYIDRAKYAIPQDATVVKAYMSTGLDKPIALIIIK